MQISACSISREGNHGGERRERKVAGGRERERERIEETKIRNAGINSQQGERNEINTSISAVIAAGVNKGLIEREFAPELAMFRVSRSKESDLYAAVAASLFSFRMSRRAAPNLRSAKNTGGGRRISHAVLFSSRPRSPPLLRLSR